MVARQIAQVTPLFATAQLDQYFKNIAADKETIQPDDIKSRMKVETMNAVTALAMQFAVRQPYSNFHALMMEVQNGNNWWPERYYRAAYDFVRKGGDANLVAPELNRFLKNPEKAGLIMLVLLRFEGLRRKEKLAGGQPAADEGEAA
ncbi:MAG: hypothetical protein EOO77_36610 [Oxalobacteraceae bacterium]|nr:MAG: hypothetical protein EOO77_36610 [Oxalobacteraceae bacterium]